jgi:hypothetical protein
VTILTSQVNLIKLQRHLKGLLKGNFEFCNITNGTRVVTKERAILSHFNSNSLPYFTVYPKFQKPIKAVIQHLSVSSPAKDISDALVNFGFDVTNSVKQTPTTCRSPAEGTTTVNV